MFFRRHSDTESTLRETQSRVQTGNAAADRERQAETQLPARPYSIKSLGRLHAALSAARIGLGTRSDRSRLVLRRPFPRNLFVLGSFKART
jgi:hypothetical protein